MFAQACRLSVRTQWDPRIFIDPIVDLDELKRPIPLDSERNFMYAKPMKSDETPVFYRDRVLNKLVRVLQREGKKEFFRQSILDALEIVKRHQYKQWLKAKPEERKGIILNPVEVMHQMIKNSRPLMKLLPVTRGGITYKVPCPVQEEESEFRAMQMLQTACVAKTKRGGTHLVQFLAYEFMNGAKNEGFTVQMKQEHHRTCEANRAFTHYKK